MPKIHIGKKIREVLDQTPLKLTEFARKINLTRDAVYKIFNKESIATDQLMKISEVLNHDFFRYYQDEMDLVAETPAKYGYASKEDVESLTLAIRALAKDIDKMRKDISTLSDAKKTPARKPGKSI